MKKIKLVKGDNAKAFSEGYDEFITYCKSRNLRQATINHYDGIIKSSWYKFFDSKRAIKDITEETVQNYILFCKKRNSMKDISINTNVRGIRAILYYFMKLGYMQEFKISEIRFDKDPIETYTDEELKILLKKPEVKKCSFIEFRNWIIYNFLLATGCRAGTLISIKIKDLDFENSLISYSHTKNRKRQVVPMSNSLKKVLIEYLLFRKASEDEYLFCNSFGKQLTADLLNQNLNSYNRKRGILTTGIHRVRHTVVKNWLLGGLDLFKIQKLLGHSSLDVVKEYVNLFTSDLQQDFDNFSLLERLSNNSQRIKMR